MANYRALRHSIIFTALALFAGSLSQSSAQDQDGSKGIQSVEAKDVVERPTKPPTATATGAKPGKKSRKRASYRSTKPFTKAPPAATYEYSKVGVTIWRLQGDGSKDLGQEGEEAQTLEQVEVSTQLAIGSKVRLGIEPLSHDGYLYIIDREQFADGSYGTPHLIFPTLRTRKGNNLVHAFERVLIPKRPSYFRINPSSTGKSQTAEVLTIIISPTELQLPEALGDKSMTLSADLVKEWEIKLSTPVVELEMVGSAGETTGAKDLGQVGEESQQLTADDPYPQTVYRATIKRGGAMLVTLPLRFEAAATSGGK